MTKSPAVELHPEHLWRACSCAILGDYCPLEDFMRLYAQQLLVPEGGVSSNVGGWISDRVRDLLAVGHFGVLEAWIARGLDVEVVRDCYAALIGFETLPLLDAAIVRFGLSSAALDRILSRSWWQQSGTLQRLGPERILRWCGEAPPADESVGCTLEAVIALSAALPLGPWLPLMRFVTTEKSRRALEQAAIETGRDETVALVRAALGGGGGPRDSLLGSAIDGNNAGEVARLLKGTRRTPAGMARLFRRGIRAGSVRALRALMDACPGDHWNLEALETLHESMPQGGHDQATLAQTYAKQAAVLERYRTEGVLHPQMVSGEVWGRVYSYQELLAFFLGHGFVTETGVLCQAFVGAAKHDSNHGRPGSRLFRTFGPHTQGFALAKEAGLLQPLRTKLTDFSIPVPAWLEDAAA